MTPPHQTSLQGQNAPGGYCLGVKTDHDGDRQAGRKEKFQKMAGKGDRARTAQRQAAVYVNYAQNRSPVELEKLSQIPSHSKSSGEKKTKTISHQNEQQKNSIVKSHTEFNWKKKETKEQNKTLTQ